MSKSALIIVDMVRDFRSGGPRLLSTKQGNLTSDPESAG